MIKLNRQISINNDIKWLSIIVYIHLFIICIFVGIYFSHKARGLYDQGDYNLSRQGDFNLRYNEICAAHERINSFLVWEGKLTSTKFIGFERPDKDVLNENNQPKMAVHAYPPWHITYFYFYGWIPRGIMNILFLLVNCIIVLILFSCLLYYCISKKFNVTSFLIITWGILLYFQAHIKSTLTVGNYCIIIAALSLVFYWALDKKKQFIAGIVWAIMMIKPHVVVLFFWPLFFAKQWKTICVAVITCLLSILFPAYLFKQSPIDLIFEIPKIGAPYCQDITFGSPLLTLAYKLFGANYIIITAMVGFALCGLLSFFTQKYSQWWQKCLPVMLVIPYWTYAQRMDWLIGWNVMLVIFLVIIQKSPFSNLHDSKVIRLFFTFLLGVALLFSVVLIIPQSKPNVMHRIIDFIIHLSVVIAIIVNDYKSRHDIVQ